MTKLASISPWILFLLAGCKQVAPPAQAEPPPASMSPAPSSADAACDARRALDQMDGRAPVPLVPMMANHHKQNMREHLEAVDQVIQGLAKNDFAAIAKGAEKMGFTPQMGMMCEHMGAGAPGFTEQALKFHHTADTIAEAAKKHDRTAVLRNLDATLQTCTACHAAYRQEVVGDATWSATVKSPPAPH